VNLWCALNDTRVLSAAPIDGRPPSTTTLKGFETEDVTGEFI